MYKEQYQYKDNIYWFDKIYEVVQIGLIKQKNGQTLPMFYTVQNKFPYEIKIFYEKIISSDRRYLFEIKDKNLQNQLITGFQKEILKNPEIEPKHKMFESDERAKYEKEELKRRKKLLAQKRKEEKEAKEYMDYLLANKDKIPPVTPEEEAKVAEFFENVSYFPKSKK